MEQIKKSSKRHHMLLALIMLATFGLSFINISQDGFSNSYYAATVRSMLENAHNFFFASFDPAGFVTVDKPPVAFWIQALFAKIFGYYGWSIILPQSLAFTASGFILYKLVTKKFGPTSGLLSATVFALTPIAVAVSRTNNPDSMLIFTLMLSTWCLFKAIDEHKTSYLFISAALIGIGFNIKMMQAYLIVPALVITYLLYAKQTWIKKIAHVVISGVIVLLISFSWATAVDSIPANERPFIGSSTHNSVMELIFNHNGFDRWNGKGGAPSEMGQSPNSSQDGQRSGMGQSPNSSQDGPPSGIGQSPIGNQGQDGSRNGGSRGNRETGEAGILRLVGSELAGQISWFLPFVLLSFFALLRGSLSRERDQMTIFWLAWLLPMMIFFSFAGFFHRYYLIMLAPAIAAIVGTGCVTMWKLWQEREKMLRWLLPISMIGTALFQIKLVSSYDFYRTWLIPIIVACAIGGAVCLLIQHRKPGFYKMAATIAMIGLLLAPFVWSITPIQYGGSPALPYAGPELATEKKGKSSQDNSKLISFLKENYQEGQYLVAGASSHEVSSIIIETGLPAISYGGFGGRDQILSVEELKELVETGKLKYIFVREQGGRSGGPQRQGSELNEWIRENAVPVDTRLYMDESMDDEDRQGRKSAGTRMSQLYAFKE
ncbi:glycosyltransferase family 39 protein [Hazenella sp. IB182353]|uniref:ArnT family glycosyltransferase n=1 Tax=Polycladospora coralii TaxID=2771432 RepID=UPI00174673AB|nr:glycosyltransferase family 39 protein [Polycladospora coralii]MBS7528896.1 glycosyltransferase family 39 protein [Polycladospora coralii]